MKWSDVLEDKCLQDLPYKIELNQWGQIVMSPASNKHGMYQMKIGSLIKEQLKNGEVISECSIETENGVKVADVVWCSNDFLKRHSLETPYTEAPEICVEIISPSNSKEEMNEKMKLYFVKGAKEVWIVSEKGEIEYYDPTGQMDQSHFNINISL